jgi:hypothetical protein
VWRREVWQGGGGESNGEAEVTGNEDFFSENREEAKSELEDGKPDEVGFEALEDDMRGEASHIPATSAEASSVARGQLLWRVKWLFLEAESGPREFVQEKVSDDSSLIACINTILTADPANASVRNSLLRFSASPLSFRVLFRHQLAQRGVTVVSEVQDLELPLRAVLRGKDVIEFPRFLVTLRDPEQQLRHLPPPLSQAVVRASTHLLPQPLASDGRFFEWNCALADPDEAPTWGITLTDSLGDPGHDLSSEADMEKAAEGGWERQSGFKRERSEPSERHEQEGSDDHDESDVGFTPVPWFLQPSQSWEPSSSSHQHAPPGYGVPPLGAQAVAKPAHPPQCHP